MQVVASGPGAFGLVRPTHPRAVVRCHLVVVGCSRGRGPTIRVKVRTPRAPLSIRRLPLLPSQKKLSMGFKPPARLVVAQANGSPEVSALARDVRKTHASTTAVYLACRMTPTSSFSIMPHNPFFLDKQQKSSSELEAFGILSTALDKTFRACTLGRRTPRPTLVKTLILVYNTWFIGC
jgi:hypothetical protein